MNTTEFDSRLLVGLGLSTEAAKIVMDHIENVARSQQFTRDWYATRWGRLQEWARADLPEPWKTEFFNIIANGRRDVNDPVSYTGLLNRERFEKERLAKCLGEANANHEKFERLWYLEKDALEEIAELCPELQHRGGVADEDEWSSEHRHLVKQVGEIARRALEDAK